MRQDAPPLLESWPHPDRALDRAGSVSRAFKLFKLSAQLDESRRSPSRAAPFAGKNEDAAGNAQPHRSPQGRLILYSLRSPPQELISPAPSLRAWAKTGLAPCAPARHKSTPERFRALNRASWGIAHESSAFQGRAGIQMKIRNLPGMRAGCGEFTSALRGSRAAERLFPRRSRPARRCDGNM
jgi:hypothetical protein